MRLHLGKGEFDGERLLPASLIGALHSPRVCNARRSSRNSAQGTTASAFRSLTYRGDR